MYIGVKVNIKLFYLYVREKNIKDKDRKDVQGFC